MNLFARKHRPSTADLVALVILSAYATLFLSLRGLPFLDLPNHTARAYIISVLDEGKGYETLFSFEPHFVPYILGDVTFAALLSLAPPELAATCWITLVFILFPLTVWLLHRARGGDVSTFPATLLLGAYLSSNWFFLSGYVAFCLSASMTFATLFVWEEWLRRKRLALPLAIAYLFGVVVTYLLHLGGFLFLSVLLSVVASARLFAQKLSLSRYLFTGSVPASLVLYHIASAQLGASASEAWEFRSFVQKLTAAASMFYRFDLLSDALLVALFGGILILPMRYLNSSQSGRYEAYPTPAPPPLLRSELFLSATAIAALYLLLPETLGPTTEVDVRALPFLAAVLLLFSLEWMPRGAVPTLNRGATVLAIANLLYLAFFLLPEDKMLRDYHATLAVLPARSRIFPIATRPDLGRIQTALHPAELSLTRGPGVVPYVFSETTSPGQFPYFRYRVAPYMPSIHWYERGIDIDWARVAQDYDFLVVTKPFIRERITLTTIRLLAESDAVAVFQIER